MNREAQRTLRESTDPDELLFEAEELARSADPQAHQALALLLEDEGFLGRLDPADQEIEGVQSLRIYRLLHRLTANPEQSAHRTVAALTKSRPFVAQPMRVDALLYASADLRVVGPEVVRFWDAYSQPDDSFGAVTMLSILDNGDPGGLALLKQKLAAPLHSDDEKRGWVYHGILPHRNEPVVLAMSEELLAGDAAPAIKRALVDALFDYQPDSWYVPGQYATPPATSELSPEARRRLRKIGAYVLDHVSLTPQQQAAVRATLDETAQGDSSPLLRSGSPGKP